MRNRRLDLFECAVSARTHWTFVRVQTSDGVVGFGECSDAGRPEQVRAVFEDVGAAFADALDGTLAPSEIAELTTAAAAPGADLLRRTVVGGLEQALCDIAARRADEPLWKWLGGVAGDPIPLYANVNRVVGSRLPEDVAAAGWNAVADGFATIKCAPFDVALEGSSIVAAGLARLRTLRAAVGSTVEVLVDCHERLSMPDVLRILPDLEELDIAWLEDAVACSDTAGLRALRAATGLRLAGGEVAGSPHEVLPAVEENLLDVVMPDVKHAAGLLRAMQIGHAVPSARVSPHNPSGPIATAMSAHLGSSLPNFTVLEYAHGEAEWRAELVGGAEIVEAGELRLPDGPGLGIDLDTDHPALLHASSMTV